MGCPTTGPVVAEPHEKNPPCTRLPVSVGVTHYWKTTILYAKEVLMVFYFTKKG